MRQAARLQITPDRVIEHLLVDDIVTPFEQMDDGWFVSTFSDETTEALAAVQRLTTLFANVHIPDWEAVINDPMIAMANTNIDDWV